MRVYRFLLVSLLLIPAFSMASFAVDFGALAASDSVTYGTFEGEAEFDQQAAAELSLSLSPDETAEFSLRGRYEYLLSGEPYYVSLEELRYTLRSGFGDRGFFAFQMGRFRERDATGLIFDETVDGFSLAFGLPGVSVSATAGYTGLVFQESSSVFVSIADAVDLDDEEDPFGPPRLYVAAEGLHLLGDGGLTLGFALAAQFDMHDRDDLVRPGDSILTGAFGGPVQTQYQTLRLFGPIEEWLSFDLFTSFVTGSMVVPNVATLSFEKDPILGFLSGGSVTASFPADSRPTITAGAVFASGDDDSVSIIEGNQSGYATAFVPISSHVDDPWSREGGALVTNTLVYSNIVLVDLGASVRPFGSLPGYVAQNTTVSAGGATVLRPSEGAAPLGGVVSSYDGAYLGTEANLGISVGVAPFLHFEIEGGLFFPSAEAFGSSNAWYLAVGRLRAEY